MFFVGVTTGVSICVPKVSDIMDFIGSSLATLQVFVFPALLLYHINKPYTDPHTQLTASSYLQARRSVVPPKRCEGIPNLSTQTATIISGIYLSVGLVVCVAYYATL